MRWECCECGSVVERHRPPVLCPECGTAGATFVEAEGPGRFPELGDNLRDLWLQMGLERSAGEVRSPFMI